MNFPRFMQVAAAALLATTSALASAQGGNFPNKPITIVVPFPAGGVTDQLARGVGQKMSESLKVPVIVDNRPGAGAQIAANFVKQAPADGHTIFIGDIGSFALNGNLYAKLSYDPLKDFTPLARLALAPALLVVNADGPYKTAADLILAVKTKPGGVSIASQSTGSGGHLFAEMLRDKTKGNLNHVPYRGSSPALIDMVGNQVEVFFDPMITSGPFVKDGKLRALAIGAEKRSAQFPNVPTLAEVGLGDINLVAWFGMAVKAGTPPAVVSLLSNEVVKAIQSPELSKKFTDQGLEVAPMTDAQFGPFVKDETARWGLVIKNASIKLE
ncbi:tripartite tricarboxylate transporter substrate binding protein [Variovorax sp. YR216]|uniref:Bug family tripartite tricarboxylate transporter substrate binding protein n=1 Tax=Variovorax sp. YR216 TaxID=1882828 RepID=UPI000895BF23|nr:tripartite tricarboxylate transporter substrate binding protein [Variovorax sp. YR216]SEB06086.1 Tripartite-type tricarboxylate transporter, receptor component TctC [Variovorax sp. YR216]